MTYMTDKYTNWFRQIITRYYANRGYPEFEYSAHGFFVTMMFDRRAVSQRKRIGALRASDTSHEFDAFHSLYVRMASICSLDHYDRSPLTPLAIVGADQKGSRLGQVEWSGDNLHIHAMVFGHPDCREQLAQFADSASSLSGQRGLEMVSKIEFRPFDPKVGVNDYAAKALVKSFHSGASDQLLRIYPNPDLGSKLKYARSHSLPGRTERMKLMAQRESSQRQSTASVDF